MVNRKPIHTITHSYLGRLLKLKPLDPLAFRDIEKVFVYVLADFSEGVLSADKLQKIVYDLYAMPSLTQASLSSGDAFVLSDLLQDLLEMEDNMVNNQVHAHDLELMKKYFNTARQYVDSKLKPWIYKNST